MRFELQEDRWMVGDNFHTFTELSLKNGHLIHNFFDNFFSLLKRTMKHMRCLEYFTDFHVYTLICDLIIY